MSAYKEKKEIEAAEILQRNEDILAGKLVETGKGAAQSQSPRRSPRTQAKDGEPKKIFFQLPKAVRMSLLCGVIFMVVLELKGSDFGTTRPHQLQEGQFAFCVTKPS